MPHGEEETDVLNEWKGTCLPRAYKSLFDDWEEPVGMGEEIRVVEKHVLKTDGAPPFLVVKGPKGGGKTAVVRAALQRVCRKLYPWAGIEGCCNKCGQVLFMCNPSYCVVKVGMVDNSAEAFKTVVAGLRTCGLSESSDFHDMKRDKDKLTAYLVDYEGRLVIWLAGDVKPHESREFLYYITNLIHNEDAISRIVVILETSKKLSAVSDARVVSRLSKKTLDFRAFGLKQIAAFVSQRLGVSDGKTLQRLPLIGRTGASSSSTILIFPDQVEFVKVSMRDNTITQVTAVSYDGEAQREKLIELPYMTSSAKIAGQKELWRPPTQIIKGIWYATTPEGGLSGVGLLVTGRTAIPISETASRSWNLTVNMLARSPLVVKELHTYGSFTEVKRRLEKWLSLLMSSRVDLLKQLSCAIEGLDNPQDIAEYMAPRLAFHFYVTHRFRRVPAELSMKCICMAADDVYADEVLAEADQLLEFEGSCVAPELSNLTNVELALLCVLFKLYEKTLAAELKRDTVTPTDYKSLEIHPSHALDDFKAALAVLLPATTPNLAYSMPFYFDDSLQSLLTRRLITRAARNTQKLTESKIHLNVDKISLIHYLRAQRDAGSASSRNDDIFVLLNLDADISLIG
eukprot:TRINITY_DN1349_c2_g1_i10.p1 TRINITY_DN1349_c2_g1~~TRINITY_DN1349_c2_g1_i10.p1  ORF type:complete len:637 (+),score=80.45 TRINITY_DN1349_c2_g1_i10:28-1911(+)